MNSAPAIPNYSNPPQPKRLKKSRGKGSLKLITLIVILLALFIVAKKLTGPSTFIPSSSSPEKIAVKPPIKTIDINKNFSFPLRDAQGEKIDKTIDYTIEKAELTDELFIQGKKANSIEGRVFLVLSIKLQNSEDASIDINTRDYVRLSIDESEDKLAADIHSDPVTIQPISSKFTRIAFPVDSDIDKFILTIGEIKGDKEAFAFDL